MNKLIGIRNLERAAAILDTKFRVKIYQLIEEVEADGAEPQAPAATQEPNRVEYVPGQKKSPPPVAVVEPEPLPVDLDISIEEALSEINEVAKDAKSKRKNAK